MSQTLLLCRRRLRYVKAWHEAQAVLLYPPNCTCALSCVCARRRADILQTLAISFFNKAEEEGASGEALATIKYVLHVPEERSLRKAFETSYPLWLMRETFQEKVQAFRSVHDLVLTLLRLGVTYEALFGKKQASLKEALEYFLGHQPLVHLKKKQPYAYVGGTKIWMRYWRLYKSVAPYITALVIHEPSSPMALTEPKLPRFFGLAAWIQQELLKLETPNVKGKRFLRPDDLLALPNWVRADVTHSLEPFTDKQEEARKKAVISKAG